MPIEVMSSASAPFSASSRPTCGPTASRPGGAAVDPAAVPLVPPQAVRVALSRP